MFNLRNLAYQVVLKQEAATNGATLTSDLIDTMGFDEATIVVIGTTSNSTTGVATLKVQEADVTNTSSFADITALVGGGTGGFTIPNNPTATTTAPYAEFPLNTAYRKRYLRVLVSPITTQTFTVLAIKGRAAQVPTTIAAKNVAVSASA